jgi:hypothetical protein
VIFVKVSDEQTGRWVGEPYEFQIKWDTNYIVAKISPPDRGAVAIDDVTVTSRDRVSNPRRLHAWDGKLELSIEDNGLKLTATMDLNARVDPAWVRLKPGEPPHADERSGEISGIPYDNVSPLLSSITYRADGSWTRPEGNGCSITTTWSGSGKISNTTKVSVNGSSKFGYALSGHASKERLNLRIGLFIPNAFIETGQETCPGSPPGPVSKTERVLFVPPS